MSAFGKVHSPPNESWKKQEALFAVFINHGDKPSENEDATKLVILLLYPLANHVHPNSTESVSNGGPPEYSVPSFTDSFCIRANIFLLQRRKKRILFCQSTSPLCGLSTVIQLLQSVVLYFTVHSSFTVS